MVGKRHEGFTQSKGRGIRDRERYRDDPELGLSHRSSPNGAEGVSNKDQVAEANQRREELKNAILNGFEGLKLERYRKNDQQIKAIKNKEVRKFYERQNACLNSWAEVDALVHEVADDVLDSMDVDADHDGVAERLGPLQVTHGKIDDFLPKEEREKRAKNENKAKWAININVIANVLLLVAKIIAIFFSQSLSLIASTTDSALDLLCTGIVLGTTFLVSWQLDKLQRRFPVGRQKLEPLGILVFSVIMVFSFGQVAVESVKKLLPSASHETVKLGNIAIAAMAANAGVKGIIGIGCWPIKTTQVQALVQDCKTDVIFNIASLAFPLIGSQLDVWWLDPVGALCLSIYIIYDWMGTSFSHIIRLSGVAVGDSVLQKLIYMAYRFSPVVDGYKSIKAYHVGDHVSVEVDVLFSDETSLKRAHDITETLQYSFESLPEVDRAFVSIDYSTFGPDGHVTA